jgi:hypothetical protein
MTAGSSGAYRAIGSQTERREGETMKEKSAVNNVIWKGVVEFQGSPQEFQDFSEALARAGARVSFDTEAPAFVRVEPNPGYVAPVYMDTIGVLQQLDDSNSLRMQGPAIERIAGGIRTPHLHLGDDIVLVDRKQFKSLLGQVAKEMFEQRVATKQDYDEIIAPLATAGR